MPKRAAPRSEAAPKDPGGGINPVKNVQNWLNDVGNFNRENVAGPVTDAVVSGAQNVHNWLGDVGNWNRSNFADPIASGIGFTPKPLEDTGSTEPASAKPKAKLGNLAIPTAPAAAAANPWEALTKQLTDQYSALLTEYQPTASGANQASMDKTISSQAEAMLGQGAGSPMAAWLDRTSGAAQAQGAGVTNAMANQANAAQTGAQGIQSSLTSMGKAETQQLAMAPYDQLLQALAGEVPYLLVKGNLPASNPVVANAPPALNWIENQFGVTNALPSAGAASVGGLPSPAVAAGTSAVPVQPTTTPGTNSPMGG